MSDIYFSPYRISTITCNANIGINLNLDLNLLFDNISIKEECFDSKEGIVWIQYMKDGQDISRGTYPKKRRKSKKDKAKKNRFDNQVTIIYMFNNNYIPNVKIFKNGNIQLTGIKDVKHTEIIVNNIIANIRNIYETISNKIISTETNIDDLKYQNFKIRMINTDFKVYVDAEMTKGFELKRKDIHKMFISDEYNNKCSFQPGIYQGVKLEYFWNKLSINKNGICKCPTNCYGKGDGLSISNCKKVTGALFESGSILITGGITFEQVDETYMYICNFLRRHKDTIKKPQPKILLT
tara:strand:- start:12814 stop:13698 length:885 start_codon:yes stop_codon:yes gene_type:complete